MHRVTRYRSRDGTLHKTAEDAVAHGEPIFSKFSMELARDIVAEVYKSANDTRANQELEMQKWIESHTNQISIVADLYRDIRIVEDNSEL